MNAHLRRMTSTRRFATLLFLAAAAPVGALALGVLLAGWIVVAVLAITPLVVPALIGFRAAVGLIARLDAAIARALLGALTPREREVLALMAEGRSNTAIASQLVVTVSAVEKHVASIFAKLRLSASDEDHHRVLAVLRT